MEINNNLPNIETQKPINSSQLSYIGEVEISNLVKLVSNKEFTSNSQYVCNKILALKKKSKLYSKDKGKIIKGTSSSLSKSVINI